jgi:hypothetical protein
MQLLQTGTDEKSPSKTVSRIRNSELRGQGTPTRA